MYVAQRNASVLQAARLIKTGKQSKAFVQPCCLFAGPIRLCFINYKSHLSASDVRRPLS